MVKSVFSPGGFFVRDKKNSPRSKIRCIRTSGFLCCRHGAGIFRLRRVGHIPLAGNQNTDEKVETVRVILQWNNVPDAASYNVYWSRFPGVTKHNGHKIPDAANPIAIRDLAPDTTYYLVVTAVSKSGESSVSEEISYTAK